MNPFASFSMSKNAILAMGAIPLKRWVPVRKGGEEVELKGRLPLWP